MGGSPGKINMVNPQFRKSKSPPKEGMIYGIRPVMEAFGAGKELDKIYINKELKSEPLQEVVQLARAQNVPVMRVPPEKLDKITRKNHQGIIAFMAVVAYASLDHIVTECFDRGENPFILMLDRITDVRNFGAIARSAECAGVHAIVVPEKETAQIGPDALKTSAGALNHLAVCREQNLKATADYLRKSGLQVIACTEKATDLIYDVDFDQPTVVIMGSEEDGISDALMYAAHQQVKIPMEGKSASLNVSVATGIVLFEAIRQKIQRG
jgi:23S rRNA (guanosine2251-2'-O)-methyltransferase